MEPAAPRRRATTPLPETALTVSAVARRLGVAPATLRTWDRRYGIGPSSHATGSHRRYRPVDVARLDVMQRLTRAGVTPAEAARAALRVDASADHPDGPSTSAVKEPGEVDSASPDSGRAGGGRVVALPGASPQARGLARAAIALDAATCSATIRAALEADGVVHAWDALLVPVLVAVGDRWEATGVGVDAEHLLAECVIGALHGATARHAVAHTGRPVLLASAEEEMHALALHALAAALAERGVAARVLGARVPTVALAAAVRRTGPSAVFIWSSLAQTGDGGRLDELPRQRPRTTLVVGGPGWGEALPAGVHRTDRLADAVDLLVAAAR